MKIPGMLSFEALVLRRSAAELFEPKREVDQPLLVPVDLAQVHARADLAELVADPARDERGLGVVEHDALLLVEPARRLVDLRDDRVQAEREDPVAQHALRAVEGLPLP